MSQYTLPRPWRYIPSDNYAIVIEDANGVRHFWLADGEYDGCEGPADSEATDRAVQAANEYIDGRI